MNKALTFIQSFITSDLGLVATLITLGFIILKLDKSNPHKINFHFKRVSELDKAIEDYWNNTLKVSPLEYFNNLKLLKSRLRTD